MNTTIRAITWRVLALLISFTGAYLVTGNIAASFGVCLVNNSLKLVGQLIHDHLYDYLYISAR